MDLVEPSIHHTSRMCRKRPDPSSAANADAAFVRHIDLDLEVRGVQLLIERLGFVWLKESAW